MSESKEDSFFGPIRLPEKEGQKYLICNVKPRSGDCQVKLSSGEKLGDVQSIVVEAGVGQISTATVKTFCTDAEVKILQENTRLIIVINERKDYTEGFRNGYVAGLRRVKTEETEKGRLLTEAELIKIQE